MSNGNPIPLAPQKMRSFKEICKGLDGFIANWGTMANDNLPREYRRWNELVSYYWKGMQNALNAPLPVHDTLQDGFWLASRIAMEEEDQFFDDGTMYEDYAEDAAFVGQRHDRPPPSFPIGRDVYAGYFLILRPAHGDIKPFGLARVLTNPSLNPGHVNSIQL